MNVKISGFWSPVQSVVTGDDSWVNDDVRWYQQVKIDMCKISEILSKLLLGLSHNYWLLKS